MKFVVQRESLLSLIGKIQGIVPTKAIIPILSNVLIEAFDRQIVITATDITVTMRSKIDAQIEECGTITVPARRFFQLIRELTAPDIYLETDTNGIARVTSGTSHFMLHGMDSSEFPSFQSVNDGISFNIESSVLKEMLSNTAFAVAKEHDNQALTGLLLELIDGKATAVGTNGKRLAKMDKSINFNNANKSTSVIPIKTVEEIIKLLNNDSQNITINIVDDKISLECDQWCIVSKLISDKYPDYNRIIPSKEEIKEITIHKDELMTLLKQLSLFTSEANNSVKFTFVDGELQLQTINRDIGEGKVKMPVDYSGSQLEIAFNPNYFLDILKHCKKETINFGVSNSVNPGLIVDSSDSQSSPNVVFALMPLRIL